MVFRGLIRVSRGGAPPVGGGMNHHFESLRASHRCGTSNDNTLFADDEPRQQMIMIRRQSSSLFVPLYSVSCC